MSMSEKLCDVLYTVGTTGIDISDKVLAHTRRFQIMIRVPVGPTVLMARSSVNSSFSVLNSECLRMASRLAASSGLKTLTVKVEINLIKIAKLGQFLWKKF